MAFKRTILLDLDGVLNQYDGSYDKTKIPDIKQGAREFLEKLNERYEVKIFTTRPKELATKWIEENSLKELVTEVTDYKAPAYLIVDDRAVCHNGDFDETLKNIQNFKVHWKN